MYNYQLSLCIISFWSDSLETTSVSSFSRSVLVWPRLRGGLPRLRGGLPRLRGGKFVLAILFNNCGSESDSETGSESAITDAVNRKTNLVENKRLVVHMLMGK